MNVSWRQAALVLPLLLAGCAPAVHVKPDAGLLQEQTLREQALAHADHWTLRGRLGVVSGKEGGSGSLEWTQEGDRYSFVVRGPLAGKSFRLTGGPGWALLEGVDGGPRRAADAQTLLRAVLGWDVPLRDLRAWVLGLRADGGPATLAFGTDRLPEVLHQDGWTVDYRQWDTTRQPPLPQKVFAERAPYKVRLSVDSWQFP